jgi:hypothetical protein
MDDDMALNPSINFVLLLFRLAFTDGWLSPFGEVRKPKLDDASDGLVMESETTEAVPDTIPWLFIASFSEFEMAFM